jgi:hypothetical protein
MGSWFSKANGDMSTNELNELKERLTNIEKLDRDNDGVVSKEELDLWMTEQRNDIEEFKHKIEEKTEAKYQQILMESERELSDARQELKDMKKQVKTLKSINSKLEHKLQEENNISDITISVDGENISMDNREIDLSNEQATKLNEISRKRINKFVEEILDDQNINIKYLPDFVERQIYRNVFNILINLLDNLFDKTTLRFMGHKLTFDLQPLLDEDLKKIQEDQVAENSGEKKSTKHSRKGGRKH